MSAQSFSSEISTSGLKEQADEAVYSPGWKLTWHTKVKPWVIRGIHQLYLVVNFTEKPGEWVSLMAKSALIFGGVLIILKEIPPSIFWSVVIFFAAFLLSKLLRKILQALIRPIGTSAKFALPGKYFIRHRHKPCDLKLGNAPTHNLKFATKDIAMITAALNMAAFKNSPWETSLDDKYHRNRTHIEKNSKAIQLVYDPENEKPIGYTHVLPVSKTVWNQYLDIKNNIRDNTFGADLIVSDKGYTREQPYGLIIFSVIDTTFWNPATSQDTFEGFRNKRGEQYEIALVYHVQQHLRDFPPTPSGVPVMLQNMSRDYYAFLKDCATSTNKISADLTNIITLSVAHHPLEVQR